MKNNCALLAFISICLFCNSLHAITQLSRTIDKDGYTNVRSGPGTNYDVITTVQSDELFYCETNDSLWWKVEIQKEHGKISGYMHSSKVQLLEKLTNAEKQILFQDIFELQTEYASAFDIAYTQKDSIQYMPTRRALEKYTDEKFDPVLNLFANYFCETSDSATLIFLLREIVTNKGSADEWPGDVLSECFICHPVLVLRKIKKVHTVENRAFLIEDIEYGMEAHFFIQENQSVTNQEFLRLKQLIETAR